MEFLEIASELGELEVTPATLFADDDGRISKKTGISTLHRSSRSAFELALEATRKLQNLAEVKSGIGFVIYVTQSPSLFLPNHASLIQHEFGLPESTMCFDINQGCSGFVQALVTLHALLANSPSQYGLIVCADTYSHHLNAEDRATQALFSDGATATLVSKNSGWSISNVRHLTDGGGAGYLMKTVSEASPLVMDGAAVFQWTRGALSTQIQSCLETESLNVNDIDLFVLHQASKLVLDNVSKGLQISSDQVPTTLHLTGNLVSSSIPFLLANCQRSFESAHKIVMAGFGVGLSISVCTLSRP